MNQPLVVFSVSGGYRPAQSYGGPDASPNTLFRGKNYWVRPFGRLVPVRGVSQWSATSIGPRVYSLDIFRGVIAGSLITDIISEPGGSTITFTKLPKTSLVRYNQALFFVSEQTNKQVYINESTTSPFVLTGVTTSATPGKLRVAVLTNSTYVAYDAGLQAPPDPAGAISTASGGLKSMAGITSIVVCAKRLVTQTISNPSPVVTVTLTAGTSDRVIVDLSLLTLQSGQDAWIFGGTDWGRGNYGPWKEIREVRPTLAGTVSISTSNANLTGTGTQFHRDLAIGDEIVIAGVTYTVATVASDTLATLTVTPGVTVSNASATVAKVCLDWRNGELGELIDFNNDPPPPLDGVMLFNNVPFGWKDNVLYPTKVGNPEAYPAILARSTQTGANIIHALAGDARIYLLTTNGLEIVTFTQNEFDPFLIRQVWAFGFSSPTQAVVADGVLYAAVGTTSGVKIIRTRVDDSPDLEFSAPVESDMATWKASNVVMGLDPANGAVLVGHYDGVANTTIIPFMLQQGVWGLPQEIVGRVVSMATVGNSCEMIIQNGENLLSYQYESGTGASTTSYVAWPFIDKDGIRQIIKSIKFTGKANTMRVYIATPGAPIPDVTNTSAAAVTITMANALQHENVIFTNLQNAQSFTVRVDSTGNSAVITEVVVSGLVNRIQR